MIIVPERKPGRVSESRGRFVFCMASLEQPLRVVENAPRQYGSIRGAASRQERHCTAAGAK